MSDPITQFNILAGINSISALVWVGSAVSAYVGYRAFKQGVDARWTVAFLLLAAYHAGEAYVAYSWTQNLGPVLAAMQDPANFAAYYGVRLAGIELVAAFLVFYRFRERRKR